MSTLSIFYCSIEWQPVISAIPGICWGILGLILICVLLRRVAFPFIANCHEVRLKKENFGQEKYWFFQKKLEQDFKKELEEKINKLKTEKDDLSKQLKEEKENREKTLKKERLQAEHDFYEKVLSQFYHIEENQSNK